jgi:hypothetical protein
MKNNASAKRPSETLSPTAKQFLAGVVADFAINDTSGRQLVLEAARCIDRISEARAIIRKTGPVVNDRFGCPKMHPAVLIERDSRQQLAMCLRNLRLDVTPDLD